MSSLTHFEDVVGVCSLSIQTAKVIPILLPFPSCSCWGLQCVWSHLNCLYIIRSRDLKWTIGHPFIDHLRIPMLSKAFTIDFWAYFIWPYLMFCLLCNDFYIVYLLGFRNSSDACLIRLRCKNRWTTWSRDALSLICLCIVILGILRLHERIPRPPSWISTWIIALRVSFGKWHHFSTKN